MSNNIKKFNEEFLLESKLYTKSKVDDITSIYNSLSSIYDDVNSILYNTDDFEKVKETLFKQYDVKNNSDLIKDYFNDYLKTMKNFTRKFKLLFNSYDLYKKNLLNLKVKSNIIQNKSELVFKNVNFDYVFNKSKKTKDIKENLKYDIGTHLMNIIFYNNNQNGGFFSNRNKNTNKKNNYKINFKKVNEINDYDDYKFDDDIDDLNIIVKFYQKNINDFKKK